MTRRYRNALTGVELLPDVPMAPPGLWQDPALRGLGRSAALAALLLAAGWAALVIL